MNAPTEVRSKLELKDERGIVSVDEMIGLVRRIFENIGCSETAARQIAEHREKMVDGELPCRSKPGRNYLNDYWGRL